MPENNGDELLLDSSESNIETDSQNEIDSDDNTSDDNKKNSSNWKKMNEVKKELERELKAERNEKSKLEQELQLLKDWANSLYEDETKKPFTKQEEKKLDDATAKLEQKIFLLENKEAKEHIDLINSAREKYNMDFDEAWTLVKAKLPEESKSKKDFDTSSKSTKIPKDLSKVSAEDALEMSKEDQAKWRKIHFGI